MDRCDVGFGLGVISGVIALLESTGYFALYVSTVRIVAYLVAGYVVAAGLSLLVLWAAFMVYKGRKLLGGTVMFVTSLSLPVNFILFMIPASHWLLFSMIGGILILSVEMKQKRARALAFSLFAGVLAFFIAPMTVVPIVVLSGISTMRQLAVSPSMTIVFGVIPFVVAVLTFAWFSVKKERNETNTQTLGMREEFME